MGYTDKQLEALAATYNNGDPVENLDPTSGTPGAYAWALDIIDNPEAQARRENHTILEIIREARNRYLEEEQDA
ncbi:hypothetical protein M0E87_02680 [Corynebacterium sp. CCM 9185]|uniref:Uncharacterized protein n=1 Tax=Corynebacterium marambiense TaxID=2765364 RepID=A0ABS0VSG9_9CORY|nr:hypothetical protein [Corynebacterium marambiense]MBI8999730.1 hypothetical protein [Corynebacterium marambiense]MCK7662571.1 hypothetical protein [Corynebacterium marambiense]